MSALAAAFSGGLSGFLGGIGNVIGTAMSNKQSLQNIRLNAQYQRQLAEEEFQRNLQMWNLQNAYNTPSSQMQRFKDAGLNPHLIYGQGSPGNATSAPSYSRPSTDLRFQPTSIKFGELFNQLGNAVNLFMNYKQMQANVAQSESVADLNKARADEVKQSIINRQMDYLYKRLDYNQKKDLFPFQMNMLRQQITNYGLDAEIKKYTKWQKANEVGRFLKYDILPSDPPIFKLINLIGGDLSSGLTNPFAGYEGPSQQYPIFSNNWFRKVFSKLFTN